MRLFLLAAVTILVCWHALAGQTAWAPPASVKWPLLDFGIRGDSANGVSLLAIPNLSSQQAYEEHRYPPIHVSTAVLRTWLPIARRFVDSGAALARNNRAQSFGVSLRDSGSHYGLLLGVDPARPITTRIFFAVDDNFGIRIWSAAGGVENALALLATLDSVAALPGPFRAIVIDSTARTCQGAVPAAVPRKVPSLKAPSDAGPGGRVVLRFVIDTNGFPVDSTVNVLLTSGPQFTASVRRLFSTVRYQPARCASGPIPVLAEEGFVMHL